MGRGRSHAGGGRAGAVLALALALGAALGGCAARLEDEPGPLGRLRDSFFGPQRIAAPNDGLTVRRLTSRGTAPEALLPEAGNVWPAEEPPRTTLANPEAALRGIPTFEPSGSSTRGLREEGGRRLPPPDPSSLSPPAGSTHRSAPRRRGDAGPFPDAQPSTDVRDLPAELRYPAIPRSELPVSPPPPLPPRLEGAQVPRPGGPPAVLGPGTDRYRTFTVPGQDGQGVAIPQGATTTLIGPDGTVRQVPTPR